MTRTGRPRAITKAYHVVARPYVGWLYRDEWFTEVEWYGEERRRRHWREGHNRRRHAAETPEQGRGDESR